MENIQYTLTIKTGDQQGAGTDASIFVILFGTTGATAEVNVDALAKQTVFREAFERNRTDTVSFTGPDVGDIYQMKIRQDGSGPGAAWLLDRVTLDYNGKQAIFPCGQWLDPNTAPNRSFHFLSPGREPSATAFPPPQPQNTSPDEPTAKYRLTIATANEFFAGTGANVFVTLHGSAVSGLSTSEIGLGNSGFTVGSSLTVTINAENVGKVSKVFIRHDNTGETPGWLLESVTVTHGDGEVREFPAHRWLDQDKGVSAVLTTSATRLSIAGLGDADKRAVLAAKSIASVFDELEVTEGQRQALEKLRQYNSEIEVPPKLLLEERWLKTESTSNKNTFINGVTAARDQWYRREGIQAGTPAARDGDTVVAFLQRLDKERSDALDYLDRLQALTDKLSEKTIFEISIAKELLGISSAAPPATVPNSINQGVLGLVMNRAVDEMSAATGGAVGLLKEVVEVIADAVPSGPGETELNNDQKFSLAVANLFFGFQSEITRLRKSLDDVRKLAFKSFDVVEELAAAERAATKAVQAGGRTSDAVLNLGVDRLVRELRFVIWSRLLPVRFFIRPEFLRSADNSAEVSCQAEYDSRRSNASVIGVSRALTMERVPSRAGDFTQSQHQYYVWRLVRGNADTNEDINSIAGSGIQLTGLLLEIFKSKASIASFVPCAPKAVASRTFTPVVGREVRQDDTSASNAAPLRNEIRLMKQTITHPIRFTGAPILHETERSGPSVNHFFYFMHELAGEFDLVQQAAG